MKLYNGIAILENDLISKWIEETGRLDHDQNLLPRALEFIKEGDTVIDVGAYIGDHTIAYAGKVGREGKVIAFEPNKDAFECLEHNMKDLENVEIRKEGVSDKGGYISLVKNDTNVGATFAKKSKKGIKCVTIDSLELDKLDFLKIDAEGFEHNILKGAEETIKKLKPVILLEINNEALKRNETTENDVYIYLSELGYTYRNIYGGPLHGDQVEVICTKK